MSTYIFELIHSNIWGPSSISDIGGSRYFIVFVDDYSRYSWILHMKHRSKLLQVYFNFAKMVEAKFSNRIKIFWSDNALEYTQYAFQAILHSYGTIHHLIYPGTSQQNGRAKWKFRHILDIVCALLFGVKLLIAFPILSSKTKLHMSVFLGHLQTITTFTLSILLISFFFSRMSITNVTLNLGFVVFLAMAKLKRGINVMILSLIIFVSPKIFSFGNIASLLSSFTFVLPYLPTLS